MLGLITSWSQVSQFVYFNCTGDSVALPDQGSNLGGRPKYVKLLRTKGISQQGVCCVAIVVFISTYLQRKW